MIYHLIDAKSAHHAPNIINNIIRYAGLCKTSKNDHVFILLNFDEKKHKEVLEKISDISAENLRLVDKGWRNLRKEMLPLKKLKCSIIIHGVNSRSFWLTFASLPASLISKAVWVCWGAGVEKCRSIRPAYFIDLIKGRVMRYFKCVVTLLEKDKDLIEKNFVIKKVIVAPYLSQSLDIDSPLYDFDKSSKKSNESITKVLLGNSAWPTNNHLQALQLLSAYDRTNIKVYCPVSYGPTDSEYVKQVIQMGTELFGERFVPIKELFSTENYVKFIYDMDIIINYADRQMALFVLYVGVNLRKKIVLKLNSANHEWFRSLNIEVCALEELKDSENFREPLSESVLDLNQVNFKKFTDQANIAKSWSYIYKY